MAVPPFNRIDRDSREDDSQVQVITAGHAGGTCQPDDLAALYFITRMREYLAQMGVEALQSHAVVDDDDITVNTHESVENNPATITCLDPVSGDRGQIDSKVSLMIDDLAVVDVCPLVTKGRSGGGTGLADEGLVPEDLRSGLPGEFVQAGSVFGPAFIVHLEKDIQQAGFIGLKLLQELSGRLRRAQQNVRDLALKDSSAKVASLLIFLAEKYGDVRRDKIILDISLTQKEMANMIGSSRETVSRVLGRFENDGLIKTSRKKITIYKPEEIKDYT